MRLWELYHESCPSFLQELADAPAMQRLEDIGMNCGCEYTGFPIYRHLGPHSRYDHSVGVGLIVWHFTHDRTQAAAGLFHDIATPVFAHVVDFLRGDYLSQESTEDGTLSVIMNSPELMATLKRYQIVPEDTGDYHRYPIADNDAPRLAADRLEYTLSNMVNFGYASRSETAAFYRDLCIAENEDGLPELAFQTGETALDFSMRALCLSRLYESKEDRYAMEMLSELLREALSLGVLKRSELYTSETAVIQKLRSDTRTAWAWNHYRMLSSVRSAEQPLDNGPWRQIQVKRRYMDPLIAGEGRVSHCNPLYRSALDEYRADDLGEWLCGYAVPVEECESSEKEI